MLKYLFAAAMALAAAEAHAQAPQAAAAPDYSQDSAWICLPGRQDSCGTPLSTTALNANGYGSVGQSRPASDARADCFYVYPTVSSDPGDNSDLTPGAEEPGTTMLQFGRFSSVCRTFAPLYRQLTATAMPKAMAGADLTANMNLGYEDVRAAWRDYLQNRNGGRPFVLVGHSQGTIHLIRLIQEEIEGKEPARRMLSAMLIGFNVEVPEGKLVGGTFKETPLCTRIGQTGCIVTYVSFRATNPPQRGLFGRASRPGMTVACTNPATLRAGTAPLDSYWFTQPTFMSAPVQWSSQGAAPTPFVRTDGLVSAACVNRGPEGYLSVMINADPADARTDQIPGDLVARGRAQQAWGLHLVDVNLAQGDLIRLVEEQAASFGRR